MNILNHRAPASVFKTWEDLKLKCKLEWPNYFQCVSLNVFSLASYWKEGDWSIVVRICWITGFGLKGTYVNHPRWKKNMRE